MTAAAPLGAVVLVDVVLVDVVLVEAGPVGVVSATVERGTRQLKTAVCRLPGSCWGSPVGPRFSVDPYGPPGSSRKLGTSKVPVTWRASLPFSAFVKFVTFVTVNDGAR